jgi:hypothetical protein
VTGSDRRALAALAARAAWGTVLLAAPGRALAVLGGADVAPARRVCRVLGVRQLLQSILQATIGARIDRLACVVDVLHGASCFAFGLADRRWRRAALTDGTIAAGLALADLRLG